MCIRDRYNIPVEFYKQLQEGKDYVHPKGTVVPNEELTVAHAPARSYAYCSDTIYHPEYITFLRDIDLLYHEATYMKDNTDKALARFHCTAEQAALAAKAIQPRKLIIGHFSSRYDVLDDFLTEAREIFPNTDLATEGSAIDVLKL